MRAIFFSLLAGLALFLGGCASSEPRPASFSDVPPPSSPQMEGGAASAPAVPAPTEPVNVGSAPELIVTPDTLLEGQVVSVNDAGRFAVLRFPLGRLPAPESTLWVYRQGLKVGEVKVSGLQKERKDDLVVADIREGDCRVADVVRDR
jgi:hypothetical protein